MIDIIDGDGQTPLHWAIDKGHMDVVSLLIQKGASLDNRDKFLHSALHRAAALGQTEVVEMLLNKNADPNLQNNNGWSALHVSCYYFHSDIVELLLSKCKDNIQVNLPNKDGWTPLHCVSMQGFAPLASMLIKYGSDVNKVSADGTTPLHIAVKEGRLDVVKVLTEEGKAKTTLRNADGKRAVDLTTNPAIVAILKAFSPISPREGPSSTPDLSKSTPANRKKRKGSKRSKVGDEKRLSTANAADFILPISDQGSAGLQRLLTDLQQENFDYKKQLLAEQRENARLRERLLKHASHSHEKKAANNEDASATIHKLRDRLDREKQKQLCKKCTKKKIDTVLFPCLHFRYCKSCTDEMQNCIKCGLSITGWTKVRI
eukprot:TRINITY_DN2096_c0_g1_i1.p1 TRINITY_DN2096_c0_g1~~TRINITY_DN2096_c0_g1_i1.p1  ORF type:complete len:374 (+),score=59.89 TRINITY_DN2096_c0_g1_i1:128-1249(+)